MKLLKGKRLKPVLIRAGSGADSSHGRVHFLSAVSISFDGWKRAARKVALSSGLCYRPGQLRLHLRLLVDWSVTVQLPVMAVSDGCSSARFSDAWMLTKWF